MKKNILISILLLQVLAVTSQQWIPDVNKKYSFTSSWQVGYSLYTVNDTLYIGGAFARISDVNALNIVRYYNGNWYPLKGGVNGGPNSFLFNNGQLYVAGWFQWADNKPGTGGLARWDGNNWWPIGANSDCGSCGETLELYNGKLFAGGTMSAVGSTVAFGIAAFDGTNWINVGNLPPIAFLHKHDDDLLGGGPPDNFIKYEGDTTWSWYPYNSYYSAYAYRMTSDTINDMFYISGDFYLIGNPPVVANGIAVWDGFEWHPMGMDIPFGTGAVKVYNGFLYVSIGGDTLIDGTHINYIGRWDGQHWQPLGTGLNEAPNDFEEFHDTLFVTGGFTIAGGDSAYGLARWYMPAPNCAFLKPTIHTLALQDTFYLGTGNVNVQFFNNNAYAQTWQWNFGDNGTDSIQNPAYTYTNDSTYTITVTVTEDGCTKTDTATIWVLNGTGNQEYTQKSLQFKVYPNPTTGDFTIECTLPQNKTGKIQAFRTTGSQLGEHPLESGCNNFVMPAGRWKENVILIGVYIDGRQVLVAKVVKK